jgi:hypothetical protein
VSTEERMTIDERYKYLRLMHGRYSRATRSERGALLDEIELVTDLHRKSIIRLMDGPVVRQPRREQRGRVYGPEVDDALRVISESFDYLCRERLTPNLVWMAKLLAEHHELQTTPELLAQLSHISTATVGRILKRIHQDQPRLARRQPYTTNSLARDIPMIRIPWQQQEPGHLEVDLVHHCGVSASGEFVHTLQLIDVATGWSERVAVLGRSYLVLSDAFRYILTRIPFPILELHIDNGSEFLNYHILRFWKQAIPGVRISRSRPYRKNDNRYVEQKNDTLVRACLGYDRLDSVAHTLALNHLYDKMWRYYNLLQPVMHLIDKIYPDPHDEATHVKRRFDQARTPFDRLCATEVLNEQRRHELETLRWQTNPRKLRHGICDAIEHLFAIPGAVPGQSEDVRLTLLCPESLQQGSASSG